MTFLEQIFASLDRSSDAVVLQELRDGEPVSLTAQQLLGQVLVARAYLRRLRLKKGDRCALLAHNSMQWVAMDLAAMAEGLTVVPLYARQAPAELVAMMKDCWPSVIACGEQALADAIVEAWPEAPPHFCFENVFTAGRGPVENPALAVAEEDVVTIIYTSGTSGEAKGVMLNAGNVGYMLGCTSGRLDQLMKRRPDQDAVFHYLPLCFAGSWIMMLTCLLRGSKLTLNTDLGKIATEMRHATPDYFLNVPALLERMRKAVDEQLWKTGGFPLKVYTKAKGAWVRRQEGKSRVGDGFRLGLANRLVFPTIRKKMIGGKLRALICGSAPLSVETQLFFMMLGIPVLQVYGLTETTSAVTTNIGAEQIIGRTPFGIPTKRDADSTYEVKVNTIRINPDIKLKPMVMNLKTMKLKPMVFKVGTNDETTIDGPGDKLFIVNGKETKNLKNISSDDIKSISILKDEAAEKLYGKRGRNGVMIITTKKGNK